jgi:hypothetical protein
VPQALPELLGKERRKRRKDPDQELYAGATRKAEYDTQCKQKGGDGVKTVQLRFTSSTEYQIEIVCGHFSNDPFIADTYVLPPMVKKVGGQSGFIANRKRQHRIVGLR